MVRVPINGSRSTGFTLLEVIIAFVIMALIVGTTFDTFSIGLRNASLTGSYAEAVVHAESRLALLEVSDSLEDGVQTGRVDRTYAWRIEVRPVIADDDAGAGPTDYRLYDVAVTISWASGRDVRDMTLRSQRLRKERES